MCANLALIELPYPSLDNLPFSKELASTIHENAFIKSKSCYFVIHSKPTPSVCQKFLCDNVNEVNVMYHPWVFKDVTIDDMFCKVVNIECGIFDTFGVTPVHLNLLDGGIPFNEIGTRSVSIHSMCFSPENNQFQMSEGSPIGFFISFAKTDDQCVLSFHIVPFMDLVEESLRLIVKEAHSLADLSNSLPNELPANVKEVIVKVFVNSLTNS